MKLVEATKEQLFQIATDEACSMVWKYRAVYEMQRRNGKFKDWMIEQIFRLYPRFDMIDIAAQLNVNYRLLNIYCSRMGLNRKIIES